jgi:hypothetical protein
MPLLLQMPAVSLADPGVNLSLPTGRRVNDNTQMKANDVLRPTTRNKKASTGSAPSCHTAISPDLAALTLTPILLHTESNT